MTRRSVSERVLVLVRFVDQDNHSQLLLGRMKTRLLDKNGRPHPWGVPGGKRRRIEKLVRAAKRELREETRKDIRTGRFSFVGMVDDPTTRRHFYIFSITLTQKEFRARVPPHREFLEFKWFDERHVPLEEMLEEHSKWLPHMLAHAAEDKPLNITLKEKTPVT